MAILNRKSIIRRLQGVDYINNLVVTPLFSEKQIGPASIDIRLGYSIIVPRKIYVDSQDVTRRDYVNEIEKKLYTRINLKHKEKFVLHPNELMLGVTLEYISLPRDIFCTINSRSSWGRLGLVIATALIVQPGYKGCLTLELANLSENPIVFYPGLLIGQLVFYEVSTLKGDAAYDQFGGRYQCQTEAGLPQFYTSTLDSEMEFWGYDRSSQ